MEKNNFITYIRLAIIFLIAVTITYFITPGKSNRSNEPTWTTEAKIDLAAIYSAENSTLNDYDYYSSCLYATGYTTYAENYVSGFTKINSAINKKIRENGLPIDEKCEIEHDYSIKNKYGQTFPVLLDKLKQKLPNIEATVSDDGKHFTALVIGEIRTGETVYLDAWTINDKKQREHIYKEYK